MAAPIVVEWKFNEMYIYSADFRIFSTKESRWVTVTTEWSDGGGGTLKVNICFKKKSQNNIDTSRQSF